MKSKIVAISLLALSSLSGYSGTTSADSEICYTPSGKITTQNITPNLQVGDIELMLEDLNNNDVVFYDTGALVGNITDRPSETVSILSHAAKFSKGNNFVTNGDRAMVIGLHDSNDDGYPDVDDDGIPCAFDIYEEITEIAGGTKFFKSVTRVNIGVIGYVSFCPDVNINVFDISPYTVDEMGNIAPSVVCIDSA